MRSLSEQSVRELGGPMSILVRQKRDHVALDTLLDQLTETSGDEQAQVLQRIGRLVFPHAFAEESVLWPVIRRELPDGEALTLRVEEEHQEVNELWHALEGDPRADERDRLLDRLVTVLREDVRDEEDLLLPRLQERVDVRRLRLLGLYWEAVRRTAPTRPHPVVSRRPPGNVLAAVPLTVLDRSRDVLDQLARLGPGAAHSARLSSGSRALSRAADAVERLAPLRRGEHPRTHRR